MRTCLACYSSSVCKYIRQEIRRQELWNALDRVGAFYQKEAERCEFWDDGSPFEDIERGGEVSCRLCRHFNVCWAKGVDWIQPDKIEEFYRLRVEYCDFWENNGHKPKESQDILSQINQEEAGREA